MKRRMTKESDLQNTNINSKILTYPDDESKRWPSIWIVIEISNHCNQNVAFRSLQLHKIPVN